MAARNAGHAPQTCAHVQLAVERRSRGRKGEIPQPRHPGVALSQTRGRRGAERFRARQSTLRQSPHPAPAPVGRHGSLYGCRHSPAERKRAWGCPIVKTRRSAQPGLPEWHAERGSACRCERPALRAGERYTAACTNVRWQPPPAAGSLSYREKVAAAGREGRLVCRGNRLPPGPLVCRSHAPPVGGRLTESWQPPAERASLCAVATAGREGRLVCRSHAPPVGKRLTERGWQPPAGRAVLCAELMRSLLAGALQREGGSRRPGGPACVPISCAACGRAPNREKASRAACWRAPRPGRVARRRGLRYHERTRQGTVGP